MATDDYFVALDNVGQMPLHLLLAERLEPQREVHNLSKGG